MLFYTQHHPPTSTGIPVMMSRNFAAGSSKAPCKLDDALAKAHTLWPMALASRQKMWSLKNASSSQWCSMCGLCTETTKTYCLSCSTPAALEWQKQSQVETRTVRIQLHADGSISVPKCWSFVQIQMKLEQCVQKHDHRSCCPPFSPNPLELQ